MPAPAELPGDRQLSEKELTVEEARGRAIGLVSVGTVTAYVASIFALYLARKGTDGSPTNVEQLTLFNDHKGEFIAGYFFLAIGSLLLAPILAHLALAVRSRRPSAPRIMLMLSIAGPVLVAVALPAFAVAQSAVAGDFADSAQKTAAVADDLLDGGVIKFTQFLYLFAQFTLGAAWVIVMLHSIRVGLVTKLVGAVGIAIGAANVLVPPLAGLITVFWVGAFTIMLVGRTQQKPPAWVLGRVVPWSEVAAMGKESAAADEDPADFEKPEAAEPAEPAELAEPGESGESAPDGSSDRA